MTLTILDYQITEKIYENRNSIIYRGAKEGEHSSETTTSPQRMIFKVLNTEYPSPDQIARFHREYDITDSFQEDGVIKVYVGRPLKIVLLSLLKILAENHWPAIYRKAAFPNSRTVLFWFFREMDTFG